MIDIHTHTTYSDGTLTPVELLEEVEKYLPYEDIINFNKFYYALNENLMEHEETNALLKIFKSIISSK